MLIRKKYLFDNQVSRDSLLIHFEKIPKTNNHDKCFPKLKKSGENSSINLH